MEYCGFFSGRSGSDNQTRGLILEAQSRIKIPITRDKLIKSNEGKPLVRSHYCDDQTFQADVFNALTLYLKTSLLPTRIILPFNQGDKENAIHDTDTLAKTIKDYYSLNALNKPVIFVLTAAFHDYKYVDLANVPYHLISHTQEEKLRTDPLLQRKIIPTLGIVNNLTFLAIRQASHTPKAQKELAQYKNGKPTVFFSLGGRDEGAAIQFTNQDVKKIWQKAIEFQKNGFNVAIGNSPRTPTNITDYLFEKTKDHEINFYNCKKISSEETNDFRLYTGKYKKEFLEQKNKTGPIYPAILSVAKIAVGTKDSYSYLSDMATLGIKTAVYSEMNIDLNKRPDCDKLLNSVKNKYVFDLNDPCVFDLAERLPPLPSVNTLILKAIEKAAKKDS